MSRFPRTLFGRNLLLLAGMILLAQLLAALMFFFTVQRPRTDETAAMLARNLVAVRDALAALPAAERPGFVERFNARTRADAPATPAPGRELLPAERRLVRGISERLAAEGITAVWRREHGALFVRLELAGQAYWLAASGPVFPGRPRIPALLSWTLMLAIAFAGALILQRRINRPLTELARATQAVAAGEPPRPLPEDGPAEIAALAAGFNRMQATLAARERERALMLAGISHDLRTPLSKLRMSVALLEEPPTQPPDPALLAGMAASCRQMDAIIGQFIDFARLADDAPAVPLGLAALARAALEACPGAAAVDCDLPDTLQVLGHGPALTRLLTNLVDNALKHGRAPVRLRARRADGRVRVAVTDAGPGIDPAALAQLRQPFARGDAARGGPAGAGLGLAIAEGIARRHGTALSFERPPGGGFEVALSLPEAP